MKQKTNQGGVKEPRPPMTLKKRLLRSLSCELSEQILLTINSVASMRPIEMWEKLGTKSKQQINVYMNRLAVYGILVKFRPDPFGKAVNFSVVDNPAVKSFLAEYKKI